MPPRTVRLDPALIDQIADFVRDESSSRSHAHAVLKLRSAASGLHDAYTGASAFELAERLGIEKLYWLAYLVLYAARYVPRIGVALEVSPLPPRWPERAEDGVVRILDVGCGPGTMTLGLLESIQKRRSGRSKIRVACKLVDHNPHATVVAKALLERLSAHGRWPALECTFETALASIPRDRESLRGSWDLVIMGHMMSELVQFDSENSLDQDLKFGDVLGFLDELLAPAGKALILEAVGQRHADLIVRLRDQFRSDQRFDVIAPCLGSSPRCPARDQPAPNPTPSCSGQFSILLSESAGRAPFIDLSAHVFGPRSPSRLRPGSAISSHFAFLLLGREAGVARLDGAARLVRRPGYAFDGGFACRAGVLGHEEIVPLLSSHRLGRCFEPVSIPEIVATGVPVPAELGGWPSWFRALRIEPLEMSALLEEKDPAS